MARTGNERMWLGNKRVQKDGQERLKIRTPQKIVLLYLLPPLLILLNNTNPSILQSELIYKRFRGCCNLSSLACFHPVESCFFISQHSTQRLDAEHTLSRHLGELEQCHMTEVF